MSSTMTLRLAPASAPLSSFTNCPNCGHDVSGSGATHATSGSGLDASAIARDAQLQIEALQAQVKMLTAKATAAVDKWADYEDEIQQLKAERERYTAATAPTTTTTSSRPTSSSNLEPSIATIAAASATAAVAAIATSPPTTSYSRLSSLLSRKSTPNLQAPVPAPSTSELVAALTREQELRQEADRKLENASNELEDLSAQLFQQANEMVATERKARAKLEARVEVLERRDVEKRKRLERLENAMGRIERVRGMLDDGK